MLRYASAEEAMAAEAVAKTPEVGSESGVHFDVSQEEQPSMTRSQNNEVKTLSLRVKI